MSAFLYSKKHKEWREVPDQEVEKKVYSGEYGFDKKDRVPVRAPDGELGTVAGEEFPNLIDEGFRYSPPGSELAEQAEAQAYEENRQEHYGEDRTIDAATAGVLRGYVPGADYVMEGAAELFGGEQAGEAVETGLTELRERNPGASLTGEIAGAVTSPLLGGIGNLGKKAAGKAASQTGKLASEGAAIGAAEAFNEAYFADNPQEVVESILGYTAGGAILGPAVGKGADLVKKTGPLFSKLSRGTTKGVEETIKSSSRKAQKGLSYALAAKGAKKGERQAVREFADISEQETDILVKGLQNKSNLEKEVAETQQAVEKLRKQTSKKLFQEIKKEPTRIQKEIRDTVEKVGNDYGAARDKFYANWKDLDRTFKKQLDAASTEAQVINKLTKTVDQNLTNLSRTGGTKLGGVVNDIKSKFNAELDRLQIRPKEAGVVEGVDLESAFQRNIDTLSDDVSGIPVTEGDEFKLALRMRESIPDGKKLNKFDETQQKAIQKFKSDLDKVIDGHPNKELTQTKQLIDEQKRAYDSIEQFMNKTTLNKFDEIMSSEAKSAKVITLINNISRFDGEFAALKKAGQDTTAKKQVLEDISNKIEELDEGVTGGLTYDEIDEVVSKYNLKSVNPDEIANLEKYETALRETAENPPLAQHIKLKQLLGQSVDEETRLLAANEKRFHRFRELLPSDSQEEGGKLLNNIANFGRHHPFMRRSTSFALGSMIAGPKGGFVLTSLSEGAARGTTDTIESFNKFRKFVSKSKRGIDKSLDATANALLSEKNQQAAKKIVITQVYDPPKLEDFPKIADQVDTLSQPESAATYIENNVPNMPAKDVQVHMGAKITEIAGFLQTKVPRNPNAAQNILYEDKNWKPSETEISQFYRYVNAAQNPSKILNSIANNKVTPEEVETLQTVYPNLYQKLQEKLVDDIVNKKPTLSYQQRVTISSLFNLPVDASLQPDFIKNMQSVYQKGGRPNKKTEERKKLGVNYSPGDFDFDPGENLMNEFDRVTHKQ